MTDRKKILAIIGSASNNSSNHKLVDIFTRLTSEYFDIISAPDLKTLPHFDPELSVDHPPAAVQAFREQIQMADGIIISTPEYVFSIPSGLKNAIEWCIATTVFTDKPVGIITASAHGQKGHEELQLIMTTVMAKFTAATTLLIPGIKGKINAQGEITDEKTMSGLQQFIDALKKLMK
jgi:chromate reductase, NAD(P)H dehydrogenase (quinone)